VARSMICVYYRTRTLPPAIPLAKPADGVKRHVA
jgi:hypothetical protein